MVCIVIYRGCAQLVSGKADLFNQFQNAVYLDKLI